MTIEIEDLQSASRFKDVLFQKKELIYDRAGLIFAPRGEGDKLEFWKCPGQNCHSAIVGAIAGNQKWNDLAFSISMRKSVEDGIRSGYFSNDYYPWLTWLNYLMLDSPVSQLFTTMRTLSTMRCMREGLFPVDIDKVPANVAMFGMLAIRHMWEAGIEEWPKRFYRLKNNVVSYDLAFLLAPYFACDGQTLTWSPITGNTNHMVFCPGDIGFDYVRNYLTHTWVNVAPKSLTEGGNYQDTAHNTPEWNVYSLFKDKSESSGKAMSNHKGEWMLFLEGIAKKYPKLTLYDIRNEVQAKFPDINIKGIYD